MPFTLLPAPPVSKSYLHLCKGSWKYFHIKDYIKVIIILFVKFIWDLIWYFFYFSGGELYSGTVSDFSGTDALIYRNPLRTEQYDLKHLNCKYNYFWIPKRMHLLPSINNVAQFPPRNYWIQIWTAPKTFWFYSRARFSIASPYLSKSILYV